jgi:hypothetical protein
MSSARSQLHDSKSKDLDPDLLKQLITNQAQDIALRKLELDAEQKNDSKKLDNAKEEQKHQKEVALAQIGAQSEVWGKDLANKDSQNKRAYIFWGCAALLVVVFMGASMFMGKEEFAESIFKIIGGGVAGFFIGAGKAKSDSQKQKDEPD